MFSIFNKILFFIYYVLTFITGKYEVGIYAMNLCIFLELWDIEDKVVNKREK